MGRMPKYAARVDENQAEIVDALRKIGASVYVIGKPVDLLVGFRARTFLLEVKQKGKENRKDQQEQRDWMKAWRGQVRVVFSPEEAVQVVTGSYVEPR